jgi:hypothetical protein
MSCCHAISGLVWNATITDAVLKVYGSTNRFMADRHPLPHLLPAATTNTRRPALSILRLLPSVAQTDDSPLASQPLPKPSNKRQPTPNSPSFPDLLAVLARKVMAKEGQSSGIGLCVSGGRGGTLPGWREVFRGVAVADIVSGEGNGL